MLYHLQSCWTVSPKDSSNLHTSKVTTNVLRHPPELCGKMLLKILCTQVTHRALESKLALLEASSHDG